MKYLTNNGYLFLLQVTVIVMKMQWPVLKNGGSIPREERSQHQGQDASLYNRYL